MYEDDCYWPEWVEEMYDQDYEEYNYYLSQSCEDDWEFLEE